MSKPEQPVILVVGEDEPTRSQFTRALTDAGCDVATAADGASALAIVDARPVSVMLLDHEARGMSDRQIVEHLRAGAKTRSLPVILMTSAAAEVIDALGGLDASAFDYLVTSVDLPELVARVQAQVRVTRSEDRARRVVEGEDRARRIVETRTDVFVSFDEDDVITTWTPEAEELFGWRDVEAIGRSFGETLLAQHHGAGHELRRRRFLDLGEQPLLGEWAELIALHRDGHEFPIEMTAWGLDVDGTHSFNAFILDIPVRRQTEQLLPQTAADGGSHFAPIADLIIMSEPAGTIIYVSPAVHATLGWRPDELVGTSHENLVHPDDRATAELHYTTALNPRAHITGECRLRKRDGTFMWTEFSRRAIRDRDTRKIIGVHSVARDIDKRLAAETAREARAEELRASNARLREALVRETKMVGDLHELDRMKSNLVAQVSHEVRTPLTSIVGYVDLMLDGCVAELDPEHRKMLEVIGRNTRRLTTMVEDLLTVGEIEADAFSIKPILLDLGPIIEAAAKTVGGTATLQGIHVATNVASKLGLVNADAFHIERVLLHLLFNAVKFTFAGGRITISARRIDNAVVISVSDTGLGIAVAEQDRIFDRFYRCERAINDAAQGAGMGLAIAKAVVERHGGSIGVESAPDEGTTMTVTLPAVTHTEAQTMLIAPRPPVPDQRMIQ